MAVRSTPASPNAVPNVRYTNGSRCSSTHDGSSPGSANGTGRSGIRCVAVARNSGSCTDGGQMSRYGLPSTMKSSSGHLDAELRGRPRSGTRARRRRSRGSCHIRPNEWHSAGTPATFAARPAPGLPSSCTTRSGLRSAMIGARSVAKLRGSTEPNMYATRSGSMSCGLPRLGARHRGLERLEHVHAAGDVLDAVGGQDVRERPAGDVVDVVAELAGGDGQRQQGVGVPV